MRVMTWNVQGAVPPNGSKDRIRDQIEFIQSSAGSPDILMLNEVTTVQRELWRNLLQDSGYSELVDTLDWAHELRESNVPPHQDYNHVNGNLTAIHETFTGENLTRLHPSICKGPWKDADLKDWDTNVPEKILNATVDLGGTTLEFWNVRTVPGSMHGEEKVKILENVFNRIRKGSQIPCLLAGDFNTPDRELADGTIIPWRHDGEDDISRRWQEAELNVLGGLEDEGMVDVFRDQHGYGDLEILDVSHPTQTDEPLAVPPGEVQGKRFDHMIASAELNPQDCYYDQDGFACSDHAPLIAEFGM